MESTEKVAEHPEDHATVIVNGRPKHVTEDELTFEDVVNLAYDNNPPKGENVVVTVTYSRGEGGAHGSLLPGQKVEVKSGMVFNVTATDKS